MGGFLLDVLVNVIANLIAALVIYYGGVFFKAWNRNTRVDRLAITLSLLLALAFMLLMLYAEVVYPFLQRSVEVWLE